MKLKIHTTLPIAVIILILACVSSAYAEDPQNISLQNNSSLNSSEISESIKEIVISGIVNDCKTKNPFPGVNVTLTSNGEFIASDITKEDGSYLITFLSNFTNFNVTASHTGHYSVTKAVNISSLTESQQSGSVDFTLGTDLYVNKFMGDDSWTGTSPVHYSSTNIGPKQTIKAAIEASQSGGNIYIAAGNYVGDKNKNLIIDLDLNIYGEGEWNTTINAENDGLIFWIKPDHTVNIFHLELINGEASGTVDGNDGDNGGAIYNMGTLTLDSCVLIDNHARNGKDADSNDHAGKGGNGGAIYNLDTLTILNCYFKDNQAGEGGEGFGTKEGNDGGNGGAIYNKGTMTIQNTTFIHNHAGDGGDEGNQNSFPGAAGNGGAIYNTGHINLINCEFEENGAAQGGDAKMQYTDSTCGGHGGAIYNTYSLNMTNCNLHDNHAGDGKDSVEGTEGDAGDGGDGGSIYNTGTATLNQCILDNNRAGNGGKGWQSANQGYGKGKGGKGGNGGAIYTNDKLTVTDCVFSNNHAGNGGRGGQATQSDDADDGGDGGNGGAIYNTGTLTVTGTSPDSVQFNYNHAGNGGQGGRGKMNYDSVRYHFSPGDGGHGGNGGAIYSNNTITSIKNAEFEQNTAGTGGTAGYFFADEYTFFADHAGNAGLGGNGGAIYNTGYLNLIENTNIINNTAGNGGDGNTCSCAQSSDGAVGGNGGGIFTSQSTDIINCYIYGNKAGNGGNGGKIYIEDHLPSYSTGNGGKGGSGGGIYIYYSNKMVEVSITNSTIDRNSAGTGGNGGIDDYYGTVSSNGGNGGDGGGISLVSTETYKIRLTILESTITNNKAGDWGLAQGIGLNGTLGVAGAIISGNNYLNINFCRILNNTPQAAYLLLLPPDVTGVSFTNNWWGSNSEPQNQFAGVNILYHNYYPWLVLSITANPTSIYTNPISNVAANLIMNSNGENTLTKYAMYAPDGIPVTFATISGTLNPLSSVTTIGASNTVFTSNSVTGTALVYATVDDQTVSTQIQIMPSADVEITKTVDNTRPNVGDTVTFTVTTKNNGPNTAKGILITDIMPAGFNNVIVTPSTGTSYDISNGVWTIPELVNGVAATLTMTGTVTGGIAGKNTINTATKTIQEQADPNPNNNQASASIYVPMADIHVSKTADNNHPNPGDTVTFTVTVLNDGPDTATNIQITDFMPVDFIDVEINPSVGSYDSLNGIWTILELANGASATLTMAGKLSSIVTTEITNTATIIHEDQYDPSPDNTASANINVQEADVDVTKTVDKESVNVGENVIFTITVKNNGPNPATGLIFIDKLPIGLECNYTNADKFVSLDHIGNYVLWNLGTLTDGESAILTINALVTAPGVITNIVRKIHEDQYDQDIDFATVSIYAPKADVSITNTPNQPKLNVGDTAIFTIEATNNGPDTATNVKITDMLPSGFTAQPNTGTFINGIWDIGTLEKGQKAILTIKGVITSDWAGKTIYNDVSESQSEYNSNPQTVSADIYIPLANVSINKIARNIHFDLNDTVRFLIILENHGIDEATGIKVIDSLPNDLEFVSASDEGLYDSNSRTITWNLENIANGLYNVLVLQTKVKEIISSNIITNMATQSQNEYNNEAMASTATVTINKADLYLESISGSLNPKVGEIFTITYKLGNHGPDNAQNVIVKIPLPEGLEFVSASVDQGTCNYDPTTRTLIWDLGEVKVGDPYITFNLRGIMQGLYILNPLITTTTYDPNLRSSITPFSVYIKAPNINNGNENTVNAASRTIGMQKTGLPVNTLIVAILAVLTGLICSRKL